MTISHAEPMIQEHLNGFGKLLTQFGLLHDQDGWQDAKNNMAKDMKHTTYNKRPSSNEYRTFTTKRTNYYNKIDTHFKTH